MLGHCSTECVYGNLAQPIAAPIQFIIRLIADTRTYHIQLFHQYVKLIFRTHFPGRQLQLAAVTLCPTVRPQIDWFDFPRETATRGHLQQIPPAAAGHIKLCTTTTTTAASPTRNEFLRSLSQTPDSSGHIRI